MKHLFIFLTLIITFLGCQDKIVEYHYDGEKVYHNDLLHGDLIGCLIQKESDAMVIVSQLYPVDSIAVNAADGSFAFKDLRAGNYDLTIRTDNYRIYEQKNVIITGGAVKYLGEIDLSKIPELVASTYPNDKDEIVYDWRYGRISISVTFTQPMNRESVEQAFSTSPASEGVFVWGQYTSAPYSTIYLENAAAGYRAEQGATITTYSKVSSFTYVIAKKDCYSDTNYTVTLTTAAKDTAGNHLRFPLSFTFRTVQSYQTIYGIQSSPMHGDEDVSPISYSGIEITFPRRMDPWSTEAATTVSPEMNKLFLWPEENVLLIYPGGPFLSDTTISVHIAGSALDKDGIALGKDYNLWFRTAPFGISSAYPRNAELFVSPNQQISITFNSYVKLSSAQSAIQISPALSGYFSYSGTYPYENHQTIVFTPSSGMAVNTKYTVTVSTNVLDMYDTRMKQPYVFSFVTRP
ncbi:MAG: Ig-like domain-containing protein [Bacteroidetes bacterium]|nr:Ig-like domain-containing protein [Bacteroidota bacterium]